MKTIQNHNTKTSPSKNPIRCQKITINRSDLKLYIKEHNEDQSIKDRWHFPLTALISLAIALATTTFQPNVTIPITNWSIEIPDGARAVLWAATIFFLIWTIISTYRSLKTDDPLHTLLNKIDSSILNKPDRTSVFIVKRTNGDRIELLVEKKRSWDCFFLPYVKQSALTEYTPLQKNDTTQSLGDKLGIAPNKIKIDLLQEFNFKSEKFDPPQKVVKEYHFEVFHVAINEALNDEVFNVGDRTYHWKTLNDLEEDIETRNNNKDIINHLRDNYNYLIAKVSCYNA
jgi:hypothetical protein